MRDSQFPLPVDPREGFWSEPEVELLADEFDEEPEIEILVEHEETEWELRA